ncbi:MAG TPA: FecR domain-containing protein, partial [Chitinophaga sp.]
MPLPENMGALFEKLKQGACSPAELETIVAWLAAHGHDGDTGQLLLEHMAQPVQPTDVSEQQQLRLEQGLQKILAPAPVILPMPARGTSWLRRYGWWAAACILFVVALGAYLTCQYKPGLHEMAQHPVPAGHAEPANYVRSLTLSDGSRVVLRAGSRLEYLPAFTGNSRSVKLVGEAYFDIAPDKKHPFIIYTGKVKTTVLGTAFNI